MTDETTTDQGFDEWCIVEVMGHRTFAGKVTEQEIGGASMLRLDVPEVDDQHPAFTKYFNASAIYALTPVTEELARRTVEGLHQEPIERYKLPAPSTAAAPEDPETYDYDHHEYNPYMGDSDEPPPPPEEREDDSDQNARLPGDQLREEDIPF